MADDSLYIDSVAHSYNGRPVLSGVYLSCKPGEILGLLGRNGSGKTTLLKIIFGSLRPKFKHQRLNDKLIKAGYETGEIAYLPQDNFIPGSMTVATAVQFFTNKHTERISAIPVIAEHMDQCFNTLSGGQIRLIECLLILYSDAKFILLDEPFSQVSPILISEMQAHIKLLSIEKGFIITDHYHTQIRNIATRIVLLHNGGNYPIQTSEDLIRLGYLPNSAL